MFLIFWDSFNFSTDPFHMQSHKIDPCIEELVEYLTCIISEVLEIRRTLWANIWLKLVVSVNYNETDINFEC